jgi:thiol:disulfide interchange protein DsbA
MRQLLFSILLGSCALFGVAQAAEPFQAGKHYVELRTPVPVATPGKIEVVEVFWYGCPHCYDFEPTINAWAAELPEDVNFVRMPAQFNEVWEAHARLFYTLEVMKAEHEVHQAVFEGIHVKKDPRIAGGRDGRKLLPPTAEQMAAFLAEQGIDKEEFLKTFKSFAVNNRLKKAGKLVIEYQLTGVPALLVNGKYRFDVHSAGGPDQAVQLIDYLVEKERAAQ